MHASEPTNTNTAASDSRTLLDLIGEYWSLAYAEGRDNRTDDTPDGAAARTLHAISEAIDKLTAAGVPELSRQAAIACEKAEGLVAERDEAKRVAQFRLRHLEAAAERSSIAIERATAVEARVAELNRGIGDWSKAYFYVTDILPLDSRNFVRDPVCPMSLAEQDRHRVDELIGRLTAAESKLAECVRDAARLDWIEAHGESIDLGQFGSIEIQHHDDESDTEGTLRAAIDAAIAARQSPTAPIANDETVCLGGKS